MRKMLLKAKELLVSEEGATATEYAVMLALIIIVAIAAIGTLGERVNTTFENISTEIDGASGGGTVTPPATL